MQHCISHAKGPPIAYRPATIQLLLLMGFAIGIESGHSAVGEFWQVFLSEEIFIHPTSYGLVSAASSLLSIALLGRLVQAVCSRLEPLASLLGIVLLLTAGLSVCV